MLAVVALGAAGALSVVHAARDARHASDLRAAYDGLRYASAIELSAVRSPRSGRAHARGEFLDGSRQAAAALRRARANATSMDLRRVDELDRLQRTVLERGSPLFAADLSRGPARTARGGLERVLRRLGGHAAAASGELRLRGAGRWPAGSGDLVGLAAMVLVFCLGLALALGLLVRLIGYRRREKSAHQRELERLEQAALTDNLTGLRNHRAFQEDLKREIARRNRTGNAFSIMMIDLDGLKRINDSHGHQAGDERIRAVADCIGKAVRDGDAAYRVGGDEFVLLLANERAWGAMMVAERLHAEVAKKHGQVSVTVGLTESTGTEGRDTLIGRADIALYEAKRTHLNTVVYSPGLEPPRAAGDLDEQRHHQKILATALARAVDAKDAGTRNHCETVAGICALMGAQLGLAPERIQQLRTAGLLHDVGKVGIADAILQKPDKLASEERAVMATHTRIGQTIIEATELREEADWVLHHHEHFDGSGYPDCLKGDEIPLESRIIHVADAFEAINSDRPYRRGRSPEEALEELAANAGAQFDPRCVEALRAVFGHQSSIPLDAELDELRARRDARGLAAARAVTGRAGA